jgi:branched-chain amino acid transport system ATP-binding protein
MEALRIISQNEHRNLWRIATTIDQVADEMDAGAARLIRPSFTSVFDYIEQFGPLRTTPRKTTFCFACCASAA